MKIILKNKTHYLSRDLKKLFRLVVNHYMKFNFGYKFNHVQITCIYRRKIDGFCGGYAYYNNSYVVLKLPKVKEGYKEDSFEQRLARTLHHELDHCRGLSHGEMKKDSQIDISYLPVLIIGEKKPKPKRIKTDNHKVDNLISLREKWQQKERRAKNAIRKLNTRIKYYERKSAANKPN